MIMIVMSKKNGEGKGKKTGEQSKGNGGIANPTMDRCVKEILSNEPVPRP